jgi:hypothetical protein
MVWRFELEFDGEGELAAWKPEPCSRAVRKATSVRPKGGRVKRQDERSIQPKGQDRPLAVD